MHQKKEMTISQVAQAGGVGVETIRFYQRSGLLPVPKRGDTGYRRYEENFLRRLQFIRNAKSAGFSLKEIKNLIHWNPVSERLYIRNLARKRLDILTARIQELQNFVKILNQVLRDCEKKSNKSICPIIERFSL